MQFRVSMLPFSVFARSLSLSISALFLLPSFNFVPFVCLFALALSLCVVLHLLLLSFHSSQAKHSHFIWILLLVLLLLLILVLLIIIVIHLLCKCIGWLNVKKKTFIHGILYFQYVHLAFIHPRMRKKGKQRISGTKIAIYLTRTAHFG